MESSNLDNVCYTNNNNRNDYNIDDYSGSLFKFEDCFSNKGKKRRRENNNIQNENDNIKYNKRKTNKKSIIKNNKIFCLII